MPKVYPTSNILEYITTFDAECRSTRTTRILATSILNTVVLILIWRISSYEKAIIIHRPLCECNINAKMNYVFYMGSIFIFLYLTLIKVLSFCPGGSFISNKLLSLQSVKMISILNMKHNFILLNNP